MQRAPDDLTSEQVTGLEHSLALDPEDWGARSRLFEHALNSGDDPSVVRHYSWVVAHHPERKGLGVTNRSFSLLELLHKTGDYAFLMNRWRELGGHSGTVATILNAASFVINQNTLQARDFYRRAYAFKDADATAAFGAFLAEGAVRNREYESGVRRVPWNPIDFGRKLAQECDRELESSSEPALIAAAAQALTRRVQINNRVFGREAETRIFAHALYDRAIALDPRNEKWRDLRAHADAIEPHNPTGEAKLVGLANALLTVTSAELKDHVLRKVKGRTEGLAHVFNLQGIVRIAVRVGPEGNVMNTRPVEGNLLLRNTAQLAAVQWSFMPLYRDGSNSIVDSSIEVDVGAAG